MRSSETPAHVAGNLSSVRSTILGALIGTLITVPALIGAVASVGAGHGHYVLARLLFPLPMLLTCLTGNSIALPSIAFGLAQFPLYGVMLGYCVARRTFRPIAALLAAHIALITVVFSGIMPNFS